MKNVFDYRTDAGVLYQWHTRAPRLAAVRAVNKFKLPDDEIVFIKNVNGKQFAYMPWSRPIENPSEFQKNANLLTERGVKRLKNPSVPLKHTPDLPQDPPAGPETIDHPETNN